MRRCLAFKSRHGRSDAVEVLSQVPCNSTMSGFSWRASASTRSLLARQFGGTAISTSRIGTQELAVNCAMPKLLRPLRLDAARHQRARGGIAPEQ